MKGKIVILMLCAAMVFGLFAAPAAAAEVEVTDITTLQAAINSAEPGDTIKLTADITDLTSKVTINEAITLDLNGHKISGTVNSANAALMEVTAAATITSSGSRGKIINDGADYGEVLSIKGSGITLSNIHIISYAWRAFEGAIVAGYADTELTVNNCLIEGINSSSEEYTSARLVHCFAFGSNTVNATFRDTTFKATGGEASYGVFLNQSNGIDKGAKATFTDCTFTGFADSVHCNTGGYAEIIDCELKANPYEAERNSASRIVALTGGGTAVIKSGTYNGFADISSASSTLTIEGGTFMGGKSHGTESCVYVSNGNVIITGGEFNGTLHKGNNATYAISGGMFSVEPASNYLANGYGVVASGDSKYPYTVEKNAPVAEIGDEQYLSFADAVAAADPGDTITLLANVTVSEKVTIDKNITLDLNQNEIMGENSRVFLIKAETLELTGSGKVSSIHTEGNETFSNTSSVILLSGETGHAGLVIGKDVKIASAYCYGVSAFTPAGNINRLTVTVNGTIDVRGEGAAMGGLGTVGRGNTVFTINDGATVSAENSVAIYHPQAGTLNVKGGSITGKESAIAIKGGTVNIEGGEIRATGEYALPTQGYSNGINASGAAIQIESNDAYAGNITVNITGGKIVSENCYALYEYLDSGNTDTEVASINISGGEFSSRSDLGVFLISTQLAAGEKIAVSGGVFSAPVPLAYCAAGYIPAELLDGKYGVTGKIIVVNNVATAIVTVPTDVDDENGQAEIDVSTDGATDGAEVTLSNSLVDTLAEGDYAGVTVKTNIGDLSFNDHALQAIQEAAGGGDVKLSIVKTENEAGDVVYTLSLTDANDNPISFGGSAGSGMAKLELPSDGIDNPAIFYNAGTTAEPRWVLVESSVVDGKVIADLSHFSEYKVDNQADYTVELEGTAPEQAGGDFTVTVRVDKAIETAAGEYEAAEVHVSYDPSQVEYISSDASGGVEVNKYTNGLVKITYYGGTDKPIGALVTLTFEAISSGEIAIAITEALVGDVGSELEVPAANIGADLVLNVPGLPLEIPEGVTITSTYYVDDEGNYSVPANTALTFTADGLDTPDKAVFAVVGNKAYLLKAAGGVYTLAADKVNAAVELAVLPRGDVSQNKKINISDAQLAYEILMMHGPGAYNGAISTGEYEGIGAYTVTALMEVLADANTDGELSTMDARAVIAIIHNLND